jgi:hypothetical protein
VTQLRLEFRRSWSYVCHRDARGPTIRFGSQAPAQGVEEREAAFGDEPSLEVALGCLEGLEDRTVVPFEHEDRREDW